MIAFVTIASLLCLAVIGLLVRPLIWPSRDASISQEKLNAAIYRDQLEALERDRDAGTLNEADFQAARDELALRLLDDEQGAASTPGVQSGERDAGKVFWGPWRSVAAIAVTLPVVVGSLYFWLGAPQAIDPAAAQRADEDQITRMVDNLAAKLKADPSNTKGWAMLGRSYKVLGRLKEAEEAYAKAGALLETDPDVMASYADLLAVSGGNSLKGRPQELVDKALKVDPNHPMSLMLAGTGAFEQGNFSGAVKHWERLLALLEPGSPDAEQVQNNIAEAREKGGLPGAAPARQAAAKAAEVGGNAGDPNGGAPQPAQMVARLAERLKQNPGDTAGWARLARSYKVMGRATEAEEAYGKTGKLLETDADVMADYADLLATRAGGNLEGKPLQLINRALAVNPQHAMSLMLAGTAAYRRSDFKGAVAYWERLRPLFVPGSSDAEWAERNIQDARAKAGLGAARK